MLVCPASASEAFAIGVLEKNPIRWSEDVVGEPQPSFMGFHSRPNADTVASADDIRLPVPLKKLKRLIQDVGSGCASTIVHINADSVHLCLSQHSTVRTTHV